MIKRSKKMTRSRGSLANLLLFHRMTIEQIEKLDATVKKLQAEHAERTKIEIVSGNFENSRKCFCFDDCFSILGSETGS